MENNYRWSNFMGPMAPNGTKKKASGKLKINDPGKVMAGRKFEFFAVADAPIAAADTSMSPNGRIDESNELNNTTKLVVTLPGGIGDLQGTAGGNQAPNRNPGGAGSATLINGSNTATGQTSGRKPKAPPTRVPKPGTGRESDATKSTRNDSSKSDEQNFRGHQTTVTACPQPKSAATRELNKFSEQSIFSNGKLE